jgi:hypothetical protein
MRSSNRWSAWMSALAAMATIALVGAGCGGDDDSSEAGANKTTANQAAAGESVAAIAAADTPDAKIRATYDAYIDYYYAKDSKGICGLVSSAEDKEFGEPGCVKYFTGLIKQGTTSTKRPYIEKLDVNGSRAMATVKTKTSNKYPVAFARESGTWLIADGLLPEDYQAPKGGKPGSTGFGPGG